MAEVVAGLLTSAVVKIVAKKLSRAIAEQANLAWNFSDDLEYMKDTMESIAAVFKDAEKQSVKNESVRLWLKRLKDAAQDISDMMDDYQDTAKMSRMCSRFTAAPKNMTLANKMKNMREKLRKINEQGQCFNFTPSNTAASPDQQRYNERETTSAVNEARILGRDVEKKQIIDILSASHRKDGTMVLPIYGLGGLGKSTLAQLVYNDTRFKQYEHQVWVYVSELFDLNKIGRSIISQLQPDGGHQNLDTLQIINQRLDNLLTGKKILIILDDIWKEDASELNKLKTMLHVDKKGSMVDVLVTTRSESIANQICTNEAYKLQPLADDVCWDIIKTHSGLKDTNIQPKLEEIGLDIAKKCGGVALAAQALGYLLKSKDPDRWSEINNSDIWNESFGVVDPQHKKVLPSLMLSYERMQSILRLCFSYCAIFPKGHDINEDDLVHQWVALDFIKKPSEGKEYINQLLGMSFLQHSKLPTIPGEKLTRYTMHDLVHDLARLVIGDELIVIDDPGKVKTSNEQKYCRYALLMNYDRQRKLSDILPKKVRALHFSSSSKLTPLDGSFSSAKRLRILDFSECSGIVLPSSIGQLKQLRCLIAPNLQDKSLPEAIAQLSKLQYLNLRGSSLISTLPESIGKLSDLIYLCLSGCSGILEVPDSFGGMKSLVHLDMSNCSKIIGLPDSVGNLAKLQHLDLSRCSRLKEIPESFRGLNQLQYLKLSYCYSITTLPEAIGSLNNLRYLELQYSYIIGELPGSFRNLQKLVHLNLGYYSCAKGLAEALRGLTNLKYLNMSWCNSGIDFIGILKNLEHLNLSHSSDIASLPECIGNLQKLHTLDLSGCRNLKSLPDSIGNLKNLHTLDLSGCRNLKSFPDSISEITVLKSLLIEGCSDELIEVANSKLHYSLTLPLFKVRADVVSGCSNLPLLEGTNVDELRIRSLENVRSLEEARKVKLLEKYKLSQLTLHWTCGFMDEENLSTNVDRFVDDEDLLEQLVPPRGLEIMKLQGYSGQSFPSWCNDISHHLPNLVSISLDNLPKCSNLPPLGQLPNLEYLRLCTCNGVTKIDKDFCGVKGAFRRLSLFTLRSMQGLEEWCTTYSVEDGVEEFMFPLLDILEIMLCPRLRLKGRPPVCRECTIDSSDEVISSLEELGGHLTSSTPTTTTLMILNGKCLRVFHHYTALQELEISRCQELTSLPESMRHLTSLESLYLGFCGGISALPEWLGELSSLKRLDIHGCTGIKSLPLSIRQLTKLQELRIADGPELKRWCESEENKKKLAHIKHIVYWD